MPEVENTADWNHDGRWIHLQANQRYDSIWECDYIILESGPTQFSSIKRNITGNFLTREEAEAAAMDAAQIEIDSRGPLN